MQRARPDFGRSAVAAVQSRSAGSSTLRVLLRAEVHERESAAHDVQAEVVGLEVEGAIDQLPSLLLAARNLHEDRAEAADLGAGPLAELLLVEECREVVGFVGAELRLGFAEIPVPRVVLDRDHDLEDLGLTPGPAPRPVLPRHPAGRSGTRRARCVTAPQSFGSRARRAASWDITVAAASGWSKRRPKSA